MKATQVQILPAGPTSSTARLMMRLAQEGRFNARVRAMAEEITRHVEARDQVSEVLAVYYWVLANKRYLNDTLGVELVRDAENVLDAGGTDCDDQAILIGALCLCLGRPVRYVTGGFRKNGGHSHTWAECFAGGRWISLDTVAGPRTRRMLGEVKTFRLFY